MPDLTPTQAVPAWRRHLARKTPLAIALGFLVLAATYGAQEQADAARLRAGSEADARQLAALRAQVAALGTNLAEAKEQGSKASSCEASTARWKEAVAAFARQAAACQSAAYQVDDHHSNHENH